MHYVTLRCFLSPELDLLIYIKKALFLGTIKALSHKNVKGLG